jgi:hypothetical protein
VIKKEDAPSKGPVYMVVGSRLTDDTLLLRCLLEGLNAWSRQWGEDLVIADNGSVRDLDYEVTLFKYLRHWPVQSLEQAGPNIVVAFMDYLHQNGNTVQLLKDAKLAGIPAFVISNI